ncbi:hypothetical protein OWR28_14655 [Chryseobacterium sp. 1B4]
MIAIICFVSGFVYSQQSGSVGISKDPSFRPDIKSLLEIDAENSGVLFPRLTTLERDAIAVSSQDDGLLIFNTDEKCFNYYHALSSTWKYMCGTEGSPIPAPHSKIVQQSKNLKIKNNEKNNLFYSITVRLHGLRASGNRYYKS